MTEIKCYLYFISSNTNFNNLILIIFVTIFIFVLNSKIEQYSNEKTMKKIFHFGKLKDPT